MIIKEFTKKVQTKNRIVAKKRVIRVCDSCQKEEESCWHFVHRMKEQRNEIDLCSFCARKNRILPCGEQNGNWKHGITKNGYKRLTIGKRRVLEHDYIMEKLIGRPLTHSEVVHHIDYNKLNNDEKNLFLCESKSDHQKCHFSMSKVGYSLLEKHIWFDFEFKIYTLNYCRPHNCEFKFIVETYIKKDPRTNAKYEFVHEKINGKWFWRRYHVVKMEKFINRPLYKKENVHHIDGDTLNNDISNLFLMNSSEHGVCHNSLRKCVGILVANNVITFEKGVYK